MKINTKAPWFVTPPESKASKIKPWSCKHCSHLIITKNPQCYRCNHSPMAHVMVTTYVTSETCPSWCPASLTEITKINNPSHWVDGPSYCKKLLTDAFKQCQTCDHSKLSCPFAAAKYSPSFKLSVPCPHYFQDT